MSVITIVVMVLAVASALLYNRRVWRPRQVREGGPARGLGIADLAAPLLTVAVVLVVFVLVQVFGSWSAAGRAETIEASATLLLFRETELLEDPPTRRRAAADIVCYATSVIEQDWPAMRERQISNVPTYWGDRVRTAAVRQALSGRLESAGEAIVERDGERARARQDRLAEARPTVPAALNLLMLLAVVGTLVVLAVLTAPGVGRGVHTAVVLVSAVVFGATLLLIRDLDSPYRGLTGRDPTQTTFVRDLIAAQARAPLPCDPRGLPLDDPGFRAATRPLD